VTSLPDIAVFGDTICPGDTAFIGLVSPQPGYTYAWSPAGLVLPPSDGAAVQVDPVETTDFAVLVTDSMGCLGFDTARVLVPQTFQGAGGLDTIVAKGEPVVLPVEYDPDYTFEWMPSPGPGLPPEVTPFDSSLLFILTVRDAFGCAGTEFTYRIRVVPESVQAPNVFTPNGDSFNDVFRLIADGEASLVMVNTLKIYNRWGQLVYQASGDVGTVTWDGTHQGEPAPSDAYIWVATVSYLTGKQETLTGDLTLLR
jgi:gliding motility-associated-like protein